MKRETINTFSDGMSLDLNPLGTSAKTLTNCLNGTLITYNGNELTLQNDMGNAQVGTAALPKGYVPVGMKEYGGIIYVASYNPETKKGQLGCFPSPQQIYTSEAAQTVFEINIQDRFIEFINSIPVIQKNEYKEEIFKDSITQEARVFSSGDMFIIKTNEPYSDVIRDAIDKGIITLKLLVLPINGGEPIDITDKLKTYEDEWQVPIWIYQNVDQIPFESILASHRDLLQVYKGEQGTLEIVIEFNTFELFNLYRIFSKQNNNFSVRFIGEATPNGTDKFNLMPFELVGNINSYGHDLLNILELGTQQDPNELKAYTEKHEIPSNRPLYYDLMPASSYGALKLLNNSFLKSGELTWQGILDSHNRITNWNFEINSTSATIYWTYTLFEDDPQIDHMRFVFIPLHRVLEQGGMSKEEINQLYVSSENTLESENNNVYTIVKPYYSGDFEDLIELDDKELLHNYIYLCRLDVIYSENGNLRAENGHDYKLLYTGTFFNDKDISQFANNRPIVTTTVNLNVEQTYSIKSFNYTKFIEDEDGNIIPETVSEVSANDVMFKADNDRYYKKIVGVIINAECEVTSTLSIKDEDLVQYETEEMPFRPSFAGRISVEQTLDNCAENGIITCTLESKTKPSYEGDGDEEVQNKLKEFIEQETIQNWGEGQFVPLEGATITYKKQGNTYQNTSVMKVHRGIVSRMGQEDFYSVLLESLFPVYEPEDALYNEKMFGFDLDEDGNLSNIIGADRFTGLALWLAKNRELNATTAAKDSMIAYEREFQEKTALSRYDFKEEQRQIPYHYGSYISDGVGIVNFGSEGTSRIEAMKYYNYAPIQIVATNDYAKLWDASYWDGDVDSRITNLMCLPHSDIYENLENKLNEDDHESHGREKYYGRSARYIRDNHIVSTEDINSIGSENRSLFHASHGAQRAMYVLWQSQYGYLIMNLATNLQTESDMKKHDIISVTPVKEGNKVTKLNVSVDEDEMYPTAETHLRADHMLLCLLSQILITKRKTYDLLLNAPDVAQMYSTTSFRNKGMLTINNTNDPIVVLEDKSIEEALNLIINNSTLRSEDNFIPKFKVNKYSNGYINCGGKINTTSNRFGITNLDMLFYAEGTPNFSTVTDEERLNIYPGKIEKVFGQYLCRIEKDRFGLYQVNEELIEVVDGKRKFYKIFLPTVHSQTNKEGAKYNCKNIETYKQMLEGFAYNDVLLPLTNILSIQGESVSQLNSQEDPISPFFNLLYYNSINLKWNRETINGGCEDLVAPTDYSHGFAFITLFGDQSRFLDAQVWRKNSIYGLDKTEMEVNVGFYDKGNGDNPNCIGRFVYWETPYTAWKSYKCPEDQFILGTEDWSNFVVNTKFTYNKAQTNPAEPNDQPSEDDEQESTNNS